jgi:hypothetical protein
VESQRIEAFHHIHGCVAEHRTNARRRSPCDSQLRVVTGDINMRVVDYGGSACGNSLEHCGDLAIKHVSSAVLQVL